MTSQTKKSEAQELLEKIDGTPDEKMAELERRANNALDLIRDFIHDQGIDDDGLATAASVLLKLSRITHGE